MAKGHGGKREGAGRKPKSDEIKLIERLDNAIDPEEAMTMLSTLVSKGDIQALKLYMGYRYGQPKQTVDSTVTVQELVFPNYMDEK